MGRQKNVSVNLKDDYMVFYRTADTYQYFMCSVVSTDVPVTGKGCSATMVVKILVEGDALSAVRLVLLRTLSIITIQ